MSTSLKELEFLTEFLKQDHELSKLTKQQKEVINDIKTKMDLLNEELLNNLEENKFYQIDDGYIKRTTTTSMSYSLTNLEKSFALLKDNYDKMNKGEIQPLKKRKRKDDSDKDFNNTDDNIIKFQKLLNALDYTFTSVSKNKKEKFVVVSRVPKINQSNIINNSDIQDKYLEWIKLSKRYNELKDIKKSISYKQLEFRNNDTIKKIVENKKEGITVLFSDDGEKKKLWLHEKKHFNLSKSVLLDLVNKYIFSKYSSVDDILNLSASEMMSLLKKGIEIEKKNITPIYEVKVRTIIPKDEEKNDDTNTENGETDDDSDDEEEF